MISHWILLGLLQVPTPPLPAPTPVGEETTEETTETPPVTGEESEEAAQTPAQGTEGSAGEEELPGPAPVASEVGQEPAPEPNGATGPTESGEPVESGEPSAQAAEPEPQASAEEGTQQAPENEVSPQPEAATAAEAVNEPAGQSAEPEASEPTAEAEALDVELQAAMSKAARTLAEKAAEAPPEQAPVFGPEGAWQPYNGVNLIINEECITSTDIQREIMRSARPLSSEEEQAKQLQVIAEGLITQQLKSQAGKDMGFDPTMVQRFVSDRVEDNKQNAGSAGRLADQLKGINIDAVSYHEGIESRVLRELWTGAVVGEYPGVGGRPFRDRYVRPRRIKFEFERQEGELDLPSTVTVQELVCNPTLTGSVQAARDLAERLREQIAQGADFGEVALENRACPPSTMGVHEPMDEARLAGIPDVGEFLATAEPGDLSEVLPVREDGVLRAWRVLKLLDREGGEVAQFDDPVLQKLLQQRYVEVLDRGREQEALGELLDAAYVWPPRYFGRSDEVEVGPPTPPDVNNQ